MNLLDNLNKQQLEAVKHIEGPCLVMAGAGSGKTTVISAKVEYLVKTKNINPKNKYSIKKLIEIDIRIKRNDFQNVLGEV